MQVYEKASLWIIAIQEREEFHAKGIWDIFNKTIAENSGNREREALTPDTKDTKNTK